MMILNGRVDASIGHTFSTSSTTFSNANPGQVFPAGRMDSAFVRAVVIPARLSENGETIGVNISVFCFVPVEEQSPDTLIICALTTSRFADVYDKD
jgi:hypothetical protein